MTELNAVILFDNKLPADAGAKNEDFAVAMANTHNAFDEQTNTMKWQAVFIQISNT